MSDRPEAFSRCEPSVLEVYDAVLRVASELGAYTADAKKTSIHLVRHTGFAGVHPRKSHLILNVRLSRALPEDARWRSEQVSRNRWHHEVRLAAPGDIDDEVRALLREAYELAG